MNHKAELQRITDDLNHIKGVYAAAERENQGLRAACLTLLLDNVRLRKEAGEDPPSPPTEGVPVDLLETAGGEEEPHG